MSVISNTALAGAALAGLLAAAPVGAAGSATPDGTSASVEGFHTLAVTPNTAISGSLSATAVFSKASVGIGGAGLRNRGGGSVSVSGVTLPAKAAYLYWAVITNGNPGTAQTKIYVNRRFPLPDATTLVTGVAIGSGASPCWGGTKITVYKASVPTTVAKGNGVYDMGLYAANSSGLGTGEDPWDGNVVFPLFEGVSLVVVGSGTRTVGIFDNGLAGHTFGITNPDTLTYALHLPITATSAGVNWYNIGADGQTGKSILQDPSLSYELTKINGANVAGPGAIDLDGDWNGSSAQPLPQLWDATGHNISAIAKAGTTTLSVSFATKGDCLVPVANITAE